MYFTEAITEYKRLSQLACNPARCDINAIRNFDPKFYILYDGREIFVGGYDDDMNNIQPTMTGYDASIFQDNKWSVSKI